MNDGWINKSTAVKSSPVILLAAALATIFALNPTVKDFDGKIDCIVEAKVGELVEVKASDADAYQWDVLPKTTNYRVVDNGKILIFSAMKEGEYIFVCAMSKDNVVQLKIHKIIVRQEKNNKLTDFDKMVKNWLPDEPNSQTKNRLARSFELIASGNYMSVSEFVKFSQISNKAALGSELEEWIPFLKHVSEYCKNNLKNKSIEEHQQVWFYIAAALRKC